MREEEFESVLVRQEQALAVYSSAFVSPRLESADYTRNETIVGLLPSHNLGLSLIHI